MDDLTRQEVRVSEWKLTPLVCSTWIRTLDFGMVEEFPKMCQAVNIRKLKTLEGDLKNHNVASEVSKGTQQNLDNTYGQMADCLPRFMEPMLCKILFTTRKISV
ncbi:uncharacterized protein LOC143156506 isoform X3 [Aptenodytes patagonicus]|uniref:uncharacterized protein LOC143156506 isoform X3 n=1 Tax=Aptenodytes patagonicus TaxID=9234 RepID=UPI003F9FA6B9